MFPKFCKDCAFFVPNADGAFLPTLGLCGRSAKVLNPVTGEARHRFCENERDNSSASACGPTGRFFQMADPQPEAA